MEGKRVIAEGVQVLTVVTTLSLMGLDGLPHSRTMSQVGGRYAFLRLLVSLKAADAL